MHQSCAPRAEIVERPPSLLPSPRAPWVAPSGEQADQTRASALAALAGTPLAARFCAWAGFSGRRYVFSVYPAADCPAFCDAVMVAAVRDDAGHPRILSVCDTGAFPEPVVAQAAREWRAHGASLKLHLHLLARSRAERDAAIADLELAQFRGNDDWV